MNFPGKEKLKKKWNNYRKPSMYEKGYRAKFDQGYEKEKDSYQRYQSVIKRKIEVESDIAYEKGLAVESRERDQELTKQLKENKYLFEEPCVILNPYGRTPLCAYVMFWTEEPCAVQFTVKGKTKEADICEKIVTLENWHRVPVYGLYPEMENEVKLEMIDKSGTVIAEKKLMILTDKLPDSMNGSGAGKEKDREICDETNFSSRKKYAISGCL